MVVAAAQQTVCVQVGHRACPRPSTARPAGVDRAQLRDPRAARLSARHHPAAAGSAAAPRRRVHAAASAAAMTKIDGFKVAVFSAQTFVEEFLRDPLEATFPEDNLKWIEARLDKETAELAHGHDAVCLFVNDACDAEVVDVLAAGGVKFIAMRCAGFDRVDLARCAHHGIHVVRVPAYSPRTVAEHAFALTFGLARHLQMQVQRVKMGNYTLNGLIGFEVSGKTYGVVGTGKIGIEFIKLLRCLGGRILAHDPYPSDEAKELGAEYVPLEQLLQESDIVSLHCPLFESNFHLMNSERLRLMKPTALLINVSRGGLIDTNALIVALEQNTIAGVGMDVYEDESRLFDENWVEVSTKDRMHMWDRRWAYLKSFPQVILTPHSAFATKEALGNIADTTVDNLRACAAGQPLANEVKPKA